MDNINNTLTFTMLICYADIDIMDIKGNADKLA